MVTPAASLGVTGKKLNLLDLPRELRNEIYRFVLIAPHPLSLRRHEDQRSHRRYILSADGTLTSTNRTCSPEESKKRSTVPLLYCCRTTRIEGLPIYYGCNTFAVSQPSDLTELFNSPKGARRNLIKHIVMKSSYYMNTTRARELRRFPSLQSVSVVYRPPPAMYRCSAKDTAPTHFLTEASADTILDNGVAVHYAGNYGPKLRDGFLSIIKTRPNVDCVLITSVDGHVHPGLPRQLWADHTFFNVSLDETDDSKLSATLFKRSRLLSEAEQSSSFCH